MTVGIEHCVWGIDYVTVGKDRLVSHRQSWGGDEQPHLLSSGPQGEPSGQSRHCFGFDCLRLRLGGRTWTSQDGWQSMTL